MRKQPRGITLRSMSVSAMFHQSASLRRAIRFKVNRCLDLLVSSFFWEFPFADGVLYGGTQHRMTTFELCVGYAAVRVNLECNHHRSFYSRKSCNRGIVGANKFLRLKWHTGAEQNIWCWRPNLRRTVQVRGTVRCASEKMVVLPRRQGSRRIAVR